MIRNHLLVLICIALCIIFTGCVGYGQLKDKAADDDLSKCVKDFAGDSVIYVSKTVNDGVISYTFVIKQDQMEITHGLIDVLEENLKNQVNRTEVIIGNDIGSGGGVEYGIVLSNFYDLNEKTIISKSICSVKIYYPDITKRELFFDLKLYDDIKDTSKIEELVIDKEIQKIAKDSNVNWYELFPGIKKMEVID